jgi:pimeloyl-ACP methyl ester carboxylesterase
VAHRVPEAIADPDLAADDGVDVSATGTAAWRTEPPVLLIHGQPGCASDWDGVVVRLHGAACTIVFDRPGWDGASGAVGLAGNARAALAVLDAHGARRAVVVGHSLGGAIAAWLAAAHPDRVAALVLAAPAANVASLYPIDRWLGAPVAAELSSVAALGGLGVALSVPRLRRRIAAAWQIDEGYLRSARDAILRPSAWRANARELQTIVRDLPELERRLGRIAAPTTILAGAGDRIVPRRSPRRLALQIPGARLTVSDRAGHLLPQRDPEVVAAAIVSALAESTASTLGS